MTQEELNAHPGWECCTFEGAEMHTLLLGLKSTFREKLEWLEAAETMTLQLRAAREEREKPKVETDNVKPGGGQSGKRKAETKNKLKSPYLTPTLSLPRQAGEGENYSN